MFAEQASCSQRVENRNNVGLSKCDGRFNDRQNNGLYESLRVENGNGRRDRGLSRTREAKYLSIY